MGQEGLIVPPSAISYLYLHRNGGAKDFGASFADDYSVIEPHLPERVDCILDIGCGMAGIDVFLKRRYPDAELWLLDGGWQTGAARDGWNETMSGFSSRDAADELLAANLRKGKEPRRGKVIKDYPKRQRCAFVMEAR